MLYEALFNFDCSFLSIMHPRHMATYKCTLLCPRTRFIQLRSPQEYLLAEYRVHDDPGSETHVSTS